jgi:uncharacterized membrane protein YhaH (DUF805 family)
MKWMFLPFARIADYRGRSCRREYWMFQLLKVVCGFLLTFGLIFAGALTSAPLFSGNAVANILGNITLLLASVAYLLCFLPAEIALTVRRWHDIGNSGWTIVVVMLFGLIPVIGFLAGIVHFVAMCWPGDKGSNKYGPSPLSGVSNER